jgi:hypothetical protein
MTSLTKLSQPLFSAVLAAISLTATVQVGHAAVINVNGIGDHGWTSTDTRSSTGANLVLPGDAAAISAQIGFGNDPVENRSSLRLTTPTSNSSKSSLGVNGSFGSTSQLASGFSAIYSWMTTGPTFRTSPLKIGVQSTNFAMQSDPATRTNENNWDYILVHATSTTGAQNIYKDENITSTSGTWNVYRSSITGMSPVLVSVPDTLANLAMSMDPELQSIFAVGATISTIEFGLGSSQQNATNYIDYLQTSIYNNGDMVNFGPAAVPEPASLAIWGAGMAGIALVRRRASKRQQRNAVNG